MLIRFGVENYKSFKEQQIFSMAAGKYTKHNSHIIERNGKRILKGSFIFGANASGKTNLIDAIDFARKIILNGVKQTPLSNKHFRIESEYVNKPGVFQFDFYSNGHFYSYGFAISYKNAVIEEEWLYNCDASDNKIFERSIENGKLDVSFELVASDENKNTFKVFSDNVPDDKLLLTEISEKKIIENYDFQSFKDVIDWFKRLVVIFPNSEYGDKFNFFSKQNSEYNLGNLLFEFDTGINKLATEDISSDDVFKMVPDNIKQEIIDDIDASFNKMENANNEGKKIDLKIGKGYYQIDKADNQLNITQLVMNHGNDNDLFSLQDESDGTQRLFDLLPIYHFCCEPHVILIDELDRSFHTKLVEKFILSYYEYSLNAESQVIATVHDSNIMDLNLLRQDEIWFVQRENNHSSTIYSLSKFKERFDKKIDRDYLLGRYGAIPCFSQVHVVDEVT